MPPGFVSATPDRPAPAASYDVVVIGGGLLGAAAAAALIRLAPGTRVLLAEADGLPNEAGATVASPGLAPPDERSAGAEGEAARARRWARTWIGRSLPGAAGLRSGWLRLLPPGGAPPPGAARLDALLERDVLWAVQAVSGVRPERPAVLDEGGYVSAEALALALARDAVRSGVDLLLNARVRPHGPRRLQLERLALDRRMELGVRARQTVQARAVVVACGAAGAEVAEAGLDTPVRLPVAYRQFPRVRLAGRGEEGSEAAEARGVTIPVVSLAGWRFRPVPGGALLVPPALPADPAGYRPQGGRLLGVPVGVRRELLELLLDDPELAPLAASGRLDLGKAARQVRGALFSAPADGEPIGRELGRGWWLLAGGEGGVAADLAAAAGVAAAVVGAEPPWRAPPAAGWR